MRLFIAATLTLVTLAPLRAADTSTPIAPKDVLLAKKGGLISVEADHFVAHLKTHLRAFHFTSSWHTLKTEPDGDPSHDDTTCGWFYMEALPDTRRTHEVKLVKGESFSDEPVAVAALTYRGHFQTTNRFCVQVRACSTDTEDNGIYVHMDGKWPEIGQWMQLSHGKNTRRWDNKQRRAEVHTRMPRQIYRDIGRTSDHEIHLSMQEDGFEFDRWLMSTNKEFKRPDDVGPTSVGHEGKLPEPFQMSDSKKKDQSRPPNIVLIVADDLGYADVGCYGAKDIRTPHIDSLAKDGARFTSFCVAQPVCTASRAALLSGCYPNRLGLAGALNHTSTTGIHQDETLLPELLKAKGYSTACYGKWHLGTRPKFFPTRNGFDEWAGLPYSNDNGPLHPTVRGIPPLPYFENDKIIEKDPNQSGFTRRFTDKATTFIRANKAKPFFLYLPHVMPHVPIFASKEFKGKSKQGLYGDVVEELDWSVGEVLKELKTCGVENDTVVIFLSDNGPFLSYGTHAGNAAPFREGKLTTFEGGVRLPFLVRWPGKVPVGRVSDELVTGLDLLPTLAKFTGSDLPIAAIDGVDLSGLILGEKGAKGRESFAYFSGSELHAVRMSKWKLHFPHDFLTVDGPPGKNGKPANHVNMKPNAIEESGVRGIASRHGYKVEKIGLSLYDLSTDPSEAKDVSAAHPDVVEKLTRYAQSIRKDLGDPLTKTIGTGLRPVGRDESDSKSR